MGRLLWAVTVILACFVLKLSQSIRIYETFDSQHHCFRRMNLTHQIGCTSAGNGLNYGLAYAIDSSTRDNDLKYILHSGQNAPYAVVISSALLNDFDLFTALKNGDRSRVSGILILEDDNDTLNAYSPDRSCPNIVSSFYFNSTEHGSCRTQEWNKPTPNHSEGLMFVDFPFPIFIIRNSTQIQQIRAFLAKFKDDSSWPKLAIELTSRMTAALNSDACLRKSRMASRPLSLTPEVFCDPLGGLNIFQHNINQSHIGSQPIILVAARQDSFSLFDGIAPGADSALTSVTALLAVMETLYRTQSIRQTIKNANQRLMFSLFDGEAWDYIGSSDTVHALQNNQFPLSDLLKDNRKIGLKDIKLFIELNQLASYSPSLDLFLHVGDSEEQTSNYIRSILKQSSNINLAVKEVNPLKPMPPGSSHSFMKKNFIKSDGKLAISTILVSNHENEYTNKLYNSYRENITIESIDISNKDRLTSIVDLMSRALYSIITDSHSLPADFPKANSTLIGEMLDCFLVNSNCHLFRRLPGVSITNDNPRPPFSTYVSVYGVPNVLRQFTRLLMTSFTSEKVPAKNGDQCNDYATKNLISCDWHNNTGCLCSTAYMLQTVSPAVDPNTYELRHENLKDYALWTESKWQSASIRFFVVSSPGYRYTVFGIGFVLILISLAANHFFNRHFCDLFCLEQQSD